MAPRPGLAERERGEVPSGRHLAENAGEEVAARCRRDRRCGQRMHEIDHRDRSVGLRDRRHHVGKRPKIPSGATDLAWQHKAEQSGPT